MIESNQALITDNKILPEETYSIGLYSGKTPFDLKPHETIENPIISRKSFKNEAIRFVADPFAINEDGIWYLFHEGIGFDTTRGILYVTTSTDLKNWTPSKVVLDEPFHLSYPNVFKHNEDFYMIPESFESNEVRLYKSEDFPFKWKLEKVLLPISCVDSTIHIQDDIFWLFTCDAPHSHNRLSLFYSNDLHGDWMEHPQSPIYVDDNQNSRPAGKIFQYKNSLFRVAQNCQPFYGHSVKVFEIETLNMNEYSETELTSNPILKGGDEPWNRISMHHLDLHEIEDDYWIAFVDGRRN
jgi:hypothetical protein